MSNCLTHTPIRERLEVKVHDLQRDSIVFHRIHAEPCCFQRLQVLFAIGAHDQIHFAIAQGDCGRGFILDDAEMQCLDRSRATEVIFVALENDFRIHIDMLKVIWSCADRIPAHLPVKIRHSLPRQDLPLMIIGDSVQEIAVGRVQLDHHSIGVGCLKTNDASQLRGIG